MPPDHHGRQKVQPIQRTALRLEEVPLRSMPRPELQLGVFLARPTLLLGLDADADGAFAERGTFRVVDGVAG